MSVLPYDFCFNYLTEAAQHFDHIPEGRSNSNVFAHKHIYLVFSISTYIFHLTALHFPNLPQAEC